MTEENLSTLVPGHALSIEELSNIRGGAEVTDQEDRNWDYPDPRCDLAPSFLNEIT